MAFPGPTGYVVATWSTNLHSPAQRQPTKDALNARHRARRRDTLRGFTAVQEAHSTRPSTRMVQDAAGCLRKTESAPTKKRIQAPSQCPAPAATERRNHLHWSARPVFARRSISPQAKAVQVAPSLVGRVGPGCSRIEGSGGMCLRPDPDEVGAPMIAYQQKWSRRFGCGH